MKKHAAPMLTAIVAVVALLAPGAAVAKADTYKKTIRWSGHYWNLRKSTKATLPGPNVWSDSDKSVRKLRDGSLRLRIVNGRSVEVDGPRLGYGTYKVVFSSSVCRVDAYEVQAFFLRNPLRSSGNGGNGEQDIEFARWGNPLAPPGWFVSWERNARIAAEDFEVPPSSSYRLVMRFHPGEVKYTFRAADGQLISAHTVLTTASGGKLAPTFSYWLYSGNPSGAHMTRAQRLGSHPDFVIRSFRFEKYRP